MMSLFSTTALFYTLKCHLSSVILGGKTEILLISGALAKSSQLSTGSNFSGRALVNTL